MTRTLILLAILLALGALGKRVLFGQSLTMRHAITVTVATPEGPVSGTAVQEVKHNQSPDWLHQMGGYTAKLTGEAVVVDLGEGRYLFALLNPYIAATAFREAGRLPEWSEGFGPFYRTLKRQKGEASVTVAPRHLPRLVTFTEITDPTSVALVDPADLAATFGPGYALEGVSIAITDAPVTEGVVEGVLGWLGGYNEWLAPEIAPGERAEISPAGLNSELYK